MKVLKFGGTSVGTTESILSVKKIVEAVDEPVIVVVSALGGITDKLIATSKLAEQGNESYRTVFDEMVMRHRNMISSVIADETKRNRLTAHVNGLLDELKSIYHGVFLIRDLTAKTADAIVAFRRKYAPH